MTDKKHQALLAAEATFRRYGHHHEAKGASDKAAENFALADQMLQALQEPAFDLSSAKKEGVPDWWLGAPHNGTPWLKALSAKAIR